MTKVIVPHANKREKVLFDKLKIQLIDSISEKEVEKVIAEYLNQHNVLHL
ncbi:MAG: hypothetical protein JRC57_07605, partial [Deltaproteobacteria bacterium]|nr:hypothetical protein [Deltaproteobacteria bacterium]